MSTFRCRACQEITTEPIEHMETVHKIPAGLPEVWELFSLVASVDSRRRPSEGNPLSAPTEPLF